MKGLEVSEILLSQVHSAHIDFRIDSEFYSQANLQKNDLVKKIQHKALGSLCELIAGPFGSAITTENYDADSKCRYIRATDIKSFFLNDNSPVFVKETHFNDFPQFHLKARDILLTVVGMNFGIPAIIQEEDCPAIFSCKSTLIRNPTINPYFLLAYLSSDIGHGLVRRGYRGAAQPGINLSDIENILVPIVSENFQNEIENLVRSSCAEIKRAQISYQNAESIMLNELGMVSFSASQENYSIRTFSSSFIASGRLDAEYYLPKYEDYHAHVLAYPGGWMAIREVCSLNDENFNPIDSKIYRYIELADIDSFGSITGWTEQAGSDLPSRARRLVKSGDVLVSSIEGSLSSCAIVRSDMNGALCSTGFNIVSSEKISPEVLLVLFKSDLIQGLLKKGCSGTILTAISKTEFQEIPLPIINGEIQEKISDFVKKSFFSRNESERLLAVAKRAVELAIRKDEAAAIAYVQENV